MGIESKQTFAEYLEILTDYRVKIVSVGGSVSAIDFERKEDRDGVPLDKREHQPGSEGFVSKDTHNMIIAEKDEEIQGWSELARNRLTGLEELKEQQVRVIGKYKASDKVLFEIMDLCGIGKNTPFVDVPGRVAEIIVEGREQSVKSELYDRSAVHHSLENLAKWIKNQAGDNALSWAQVQEVAKRIEDIMEKVS